MVYHFHSFSFTTFLANPAILPVQPPIMVLGGAALILALIWFPLGKLAAPLVYPFVLYTIRVVEWFSRLPISPADLGQVDLIWIVLFYAFLITVTFFSPVLLELRRILTPTLAAAGLSLAALLVWRGIFVAPDGNLDLYLLDVGSGTAIYLETPAGYRVLINGGPSTRLLSDHLGRRLPPFKRELDLLLIASPQAQDLDALAGAIPRFQPEQVFWLGDPSLCWEAENLRLILKENQIPLGFAEEGQSLLFNDRVRIDILSESSRGGTLLVEYGNFRTLLPFGLTNASRAGLENGRNVGEVSVLLLADSGYQSSNPSVWIDTLHPQLVLLSVGIRDSQGLPDRGVLDRLEGYSLLRTDQHGTIHLTTNGEQLWIRVERMD
jgi:competence protein ComEC